MQCQECGEDNCPVCGGFHCHVNGGGAVQAAIAQILNVVSTAAVDAGTIATPPIKHGDL